MTQAELEERLLKAEGAIGALKLLLGSVISALPKENAEPLLENIAQFAAMEAGLSTIATPLEVEIMGHGTIGSMKDVLTVASRPNLSSSSRPDRGPRGES